MPEPSLSKVELPPIPAKRYFTIGEVSDLCAVKPHVLRYWEQEFAQLKPVKRRGNRRYYQHHEVLLIRRIRDLLYEQGFTISGARHRLETETSSARASGGRRGAASPTAAEGDVALTGIPAAARLDADAVAELADEIAPLSIEELRRELVAVREMLGRPALDPL